MLCTVPNVCPSMYVHLSYQIVFLIIENFEIKV